LVSKETGQQNVPDFPLYSVKREQREILFFSMDSEDIFLLNNIYIKDTLIRDVYGLKVGDSYNTIVNKRGKEFKNYTNYHLRWQIELLFKASMPLS
jgi:hypothetical protein